MLGFFQHYFHKSDPLSSVGSIIFSEIDLKVIPQDSMPAEAVFTNTNDVGDHSAVKNPTPAEQDETAKGWRREI